MIKIGYQGEIGSNSEEAALKFAEEQGFSEGEFELIPLVESKNVISNLKQKKIQYGIVATRNSFAGTVKETYEAVKDEYLQLVSTVILPIHHCIFITPNKNAEDISFVVSHIQALNQTRANRNMLYPKWEEKEANDTAAAARNLAHGLYPDNYAVICRKNAGEQYGLQLLKENIEDSSDNKTEFRVFKLPEIIYSEDNRPTVWEWISYQFASENGVSIFAKIIMILGIFVAIWISQHFNQSPLDTAFSVGGYATTIILFLLLIHLKQVEELNL